MSNCIDFAHTGNILAIHKDKLQWEALMSLLVQSKALKGSSEAAQAAHRGDYSLYNAWWFLSEGAVTCTPTIITFRFGQGRSIHTWRDFRGSLEVIASYLKPGITIKRTFVFRDLDAPTDFFEFPVTLTQGKVGGFV